MTQQDLAIYQKAGMMLGGMFAPLLAMMAWEDIHFRSWLQTPAQTMTVRQLIDNGLPENRHIVLTDARLGKGYVGLGKRNSERWNSVYVPIFGRDDLAPSRIEVILESREVNHERELKEINSLPLVEGVVSARGRMGLIGDELSQWNGRLPVGKTLVVRHFQNAPNATRMRWELAGAIVSLGIALFSYRSYRRDRQAIRDLLAAQPDAPPKEPIQPHQN